MDMDKKIKYFFDKKIKVHIICGYNRAFYNGIILVCDCKKDLLVLKDEVLGEVPIMFEEIERIEPFKEVGK